MTRLLLLLAAQIAALSWLWHRAADGVTRLRMSWREPAFTDVGAIAPLLEGLAALGVAWLLVVTAIDIAVAIRGGGGHRRAPRWVRRMVDQGVGAVLLLGVMAGPSTATATPAPPPAVQAMDPQPDVAPPPDVAQPVLPDVAPPTPPGDVAAADPGSEGPTDSDVHVVAAGENLWTIARGHLLASGLATPRDVEVHAYWVRLIADNVDGLRSGDPDLIHPGERLSLPPVEVPR